MWPGEECHWLDRLASHGDRDAPIGTMRRAQSFVGWIDFADLNAARQVLAVQNVFGDLADGAKLQMPHPAAWV